MPPLPAPHLLSLRGYSRPLDQQEMLSASATAMEIKKFIRQKSLEAKEGHACLTLRLPRHLLRRKKAGQDGMASGGGPPCDWSSVDSSLAAVHVDVKTGGFVCPSEALRGTWRELRDFLTVWHHNRALKRGQPQKEYPTLERMPLEVPAQAAELWSSCSPLEGLTLKEFKAVLKHFRLPARDLKPEDFAIYEARVTEDQQELVFPVR